MKKGTIIYFGNFELPNLSASAHRVVNNGRLFESIGFNVVFLGVNRKKKIDGISRIAQFDNMYEEGYPSNSFEWVRHIFNVNNLLNVINRYDDVCMVIAYNTPVATLKTVKRSLSGQDIVVAYDCTEWNPFSEGSFIKRLYKKYDEYAIRARLHKICNNLIVISSLMELTYSGSNILVLPPLVDTDNEIWHQKKKRTDEFFEFCFSAGSILFKENTETLIEAFSEIENSRIRLKVIGCDKEWYINQFPQQETLLKEETRISFLGFLSQKEALYHVLNSDCFVFIRDSIGCNKAGFPTKFVEAYTCGVPIITTDVSDVKKYLDDTQKGLVIHSTNKESVINALLFAIKSYYHNSNSINNTFDYKNYLKETEEWFSRIRY